MKPDPYTPPGQEAIYALREARALVARAAYVIDRHAPVEHGPVGTREQLDAINYQIHALCLVLQDYYPPSTP
jgi:hypothetical protein